MRGYLDFIDYKSYLEYYFLQPIEKFVNIISKEKFNQLKTEERNNNLLKIQFTKNIKINYKIILK